MKYVKNDVPARAAEVARQRPAGAEAQRHGRQLGTTQRDYIERLLGGEYIERMVPGTVTAVDLEAARATVQVLEDGLPPILTNVRYGRNPPEVGREYGIRIASSGNTIEPWLKVDTQTSSTRWLYRKVNGETRLERWSWPPPAVGQSWEGELVQKNLTSSLQLLGPYKHGTETVQVLLQRTEPASGFIEGSDETRRIGFEQVVTAYPALGFGTPTASWRPTPNTTRIQASGNDSDRFSGQDYLAVTLQNPGAHGLGFDHFEVESEDTCCLPFPFTVIDPNTGEDVTPQGPFCADAFHYKAVLTESLGSPQRQILVAGVSGVQGTTERFQSSRLFENAILTLTPPTTEQEVTYVDTQHGGGCHWVYASIFPIVVVWDDSEDVTKSYTTTFTTNAVSVYSGRFIEDGGIRCSAVWGKRSAYITYTLESSKTGTDWNAYTWHDPQYRLESWQGSQDITPPGYDEHSVALEMQFLTLANQGSTRESLVVFAQKLDFDAEELTIIRWANGAWTTLPGVFDLFAVSRDGQDLYGGDRNGQTIYSRDSGRSWTPCAPLPRAPRAPHSGLEFVDAL